MWFLPGNFFQFDLLFFVAMSLPSCGRYYCTFGYLWYGAETGEKSIIITRQLSHVLQRDKLCSRRPVEK